ncbi:senescence-associated protein-domain-containing protein [Fimicolochytrium jonesii]|uniref:senescence-associated protein-domain-containing protein n=1 Tax=Fimicolochytrium jonesii TaxID=1396493 RepID=UPI0022FDE685|nr:senescence-associated protein-domain-containing protein [Fimicolochytrium jonesii]KAI8825773.1 senescence-associated protein-domain-containing protein [Fimicolochytrium jonesii]
MSALTFHDAAITIVPLNGGPPSQFGRGTLSVEQDTVGNIFLVGPDWRLALPADTQADKPQPGTFTIHLPAEARLKRTTDGSEYVFPPGSANLRVDFNNPEPTSLAVFETLFLGPAPAYTPFPQPGGADATYGPATATDTHHKNSLALVDEKGDVVGVVAEGVDLKNADGGGPITYGDNESAVIEIDSLPVVDLDQQHRDERVTVRVKVIRDASSTVVKTGTYVSTGLIVGSSALGKAVKSGASALKTMIPVASTPWTPSQSTKDNIDKFHKGTQQTANLTRRAAETIAGIAVSAGQKVAQSATKAASPNGDYRTHSASWDLLKNTVHAVSTVLDAAADAGKSLYADTVEATSGLVQHRYGTEAGDAVRTSLGAVGHVGLMYFDAKGIGRRAFLKKAAKGAITNVKLKDGRVVSLGGANNGPTIAHSPTPGPSSSGGYAPASKSSQSPFGKK